MLDEALDKALGILAEDMAQVSIGDKFDPIDCQKYLKRYIYFLKCFEYAQTLPMHMMNKELDRQEKYAPFADAKLDRGTDYFFEYLDADDDKLERSRHLHEHWIGLTSNLAKIADGKYFAMVQADGDSVGSLLGKLAENGDEEGIRRVSKTLLQLGGDNVTRVKDFGGLPIYFGGDDMLFIAPLKGKMRGSEDGWLFDLLNNMRKIFEKEFKSIQTYGLEPTLSFGVVISYYKYPLQLVHEMTVEALLNKAKKAKWANDKEKGAVCVVLRKHSGQTNEVLLSCWPEDDGKESVYEQFMELTATPINDLTLRAIHWKVVEQFDVVWHLLSKTKEATRTKRLKYWFDGNFNEWFADDKIASKEAKNQKIACIIGLRIYGKSRSSSTRCSQPTGCICGITRCSISILFVMPYRVE